MTCGARIMLQAGWCRAAQLPTRRALTSRLRTDPAPLPLAESLDLLRLVNACPYRSRDAACGCSGFRCALANCGPDRFPASICLECADNATDNSRSDPLDPRAAPDAHDELAIPRPTPRPPPIPRPRSKTRSRTRSTCSR